MTTYEKETALLGGGFIGSALITGVWWAVTGIVPIPSFVITCILLGIILSRSDI